MRPVVKAGLVVAGYIVAFALASAVLAIYVTVSNSPDRQSSGGMSAFGDSLFFLAVFAVAAVPPTGAALFFLRPYRSFWLVLSVAAVGIAITGLAAFIVYIAARTAGASSILRAWSGPAVLRILAAPLFALAFFLSGVFAPSRSFRIALLIAAASEAAVFGCIAFTWFYSSLTH